MAILYCDDDRIAAAAPACDQLPLGNRYWEEVFAGRIVRGDMFETAYVSVVQKELRERLMQIGIDQAVDGTELAQELSASVIPSYLPEAA